MLGLYFGVLGFWFIYGGFDISLCIAVFVIFLGVVRNLFKVSCKIENDLLGVFIVCLGLVWNVFSKLSI